MRVLLRLGANVDPKNDEGCTPLCVAVQSNHKDSVDVLIQHGADVNERHIKTNDKLNRLRALREAKEAQILKSLFKIHF